MFICKVASWNLGIGAPNIPTVGLRDKGDEKSTRQDIQLMIKEGREVGLGFGMLPILEEVTADEPSTANRDELDKELTMFLRSVGVPHNSKQWANTWGKQEAPTVKESATKWPECGGDTKGNPSPGMFIPVLSHIYLLFIYILIYLTRSQTGRQKFLLNEF